MFLEMTTNSNDSIREISPVILDRVLSSIGEDPKKTLLQYLQRSYGISLGRSTISSLRLETALSCLIGSGAQIILQMVESEVTSGRSE
jgi:hypothetical protein